MIAIFDDTEDFVEGLAATERFRQENPEAQLRIFASGIAQADEDLSCVHTLILLRERTKINAEALARLPSLRTLIQTGGLSPTQKCHVDRQACAEHGVRIIETGVTDGISAAELTFALMLAARRDIVGYARSMSARKWQARDRGVIGRTLNGQRLGVLGFGRIGQMLGTYARAFGMQVQFWGREASRERAVAEGWEVPETRQAFFASSDVLTLQLRLTPETLGSVTEQDLLHMSPDSLLVNTSRAALIEPDALRKAFLAGRPGFLALDVYDTEPAHPEAWMDSGRCLLTPHIGFVEKRSYEVLLEAAFRCYTQATGEAR